MSTRAGTRGAISYRVPARRETGPPDSWWDRETVTIWNALAILGRPPSIVSPTSVQASLTTLIATEALLRNRACNG